MCVEKINFRVVHPSTFSVTRYSCVCPFAWPIIGNKDFSLSYIIDNNEEITAIHCAVQTNSHYYWHW